MVLRQGTSGDGYHTSPQDCAKLFGVVRKRWQSRWTDSNSAFTLDGADLIFYDSDTATKAEINLGAFASQ